MTSSSEAQGRIAVVPARGGSKRIPRKNVVDFHGKPMIHWPLEMLLSSGGFEAVVVSTDDQEIASVAAQAGPVHIVERPADLAGDDVPTAPVVVHAVEEIERRLGLEVQVATVLYPTSVFATHGHLAEADSLLTDSEAQLAMSICRYSAPIERAWRRCENGRIHRIDETSALVRSQDLADAYFDGAQFYIANPEAWGAMASGLPVETVGVPLAAGRAWDIDTPDDLEIARVLFGAQR
jgi:pseudaminic acid cytidylyltransferase